MTDQTTPETFAEMIDREMGEHAAVCGHKRSSLTIINEAEDVAALVASLDLPAETTGIATCDACTASVPSQQRRHAEESERNAARRASEPTHDESTIEVDGYRVTKLYHSYGIGGHTVMDNEGQANVTVKRISDGVIVAAYNRRFGYMYASTSAWVMRADGTRWSGYNGKGANVRNDYRQAVKQELGISVGR
tara:strand:- start:653 stop:1228 length:576 start_codon:yes stop_codon:yes gene_type:complete